jgi:DNA-binding transcriptional regulator YiaG
MRFRRPGRPTVTAPDDIDVYAIRCSLRGGHGATQENFAQLIGVPVTTVRAWEQAPPAAQQGSSRIARDDRQVSVGHVRCAQ